MCGRRAQNLLVLRSPQLFFTFGLYVRAGMDLYRRYAGFLPASKGSAMLSQSKYCSGSCQVCQTCPAAPVVRYTDSTEVVVSTDVGCCSWPFYCLNFSFLILTHRKAVGRLPYLPQWPLLLQPLQLLKLLQPHTSATHSQPLYNLRNPLKPLLPLNPLQSIHSCKTFDTEF